MKSNHILCIGSANVDTLYYVDEFIGADGEQVVNDIAVESGGQAGNIAAGIGRLGIHVSFWGNLGTDAYTPMLEKDFVLDNVNIDSVVRTTKPNNSCMCIVEKSGSRQMYAYNHTKLSSRDLPDKLLSSSTFVMLTSLISDDCIKLYTDIAKRAQKKKIPVGLDPGHILAKYGFDALKPLLKYVDFLFPSLQEANLMITTQEQRDILHKLVPHVIITCGEEGIRYIRTGKKMVRFAATPVDEHSVVDTTGAGDCFAAAFIVSLTSGKSVASSIRFGLDAAAVSITRMGARQMPSRDEFEVGL